MTMMMLMLMMMGVKALNECLHTDMMSIFWKMSMCEWRNIVFSVLFKVITPVINNVGSNVVFFIFFFFSCEQPSRQPPKCVDQWLPQFSICSEVCQHCSV